LRAKQKDFGDKLGGGGEGEGGLGEKFHHHSVAFYTPLEGLQERLALGWKGLDDLLLLESGDGLLVVEHFCLCSPSGDSEDCDLD
jgi:hypothetical protein